MASVPTTIGSYEIDRELGRGAFGSVYLAHHRDRPDHLVALKVVDARGGDPNQLLAEPALLAQVKHPCVVGVEDYFIADGRLAMAMEFINGDDLKTCLDRGDVFSPDQVRTLLIQLGGAVATTHARHIVHRDIKPANILVDRTSGRLRFLLTDFGIGRRQEGIQAEKRAGGTWHYMAPEQLRGRPGPQSDLWALGVVAYRMLAGRLPFPGPSLPDLARQIQYETPHPPGEGRDDPLPPDLEAAVMKLLDKSLSERTPSAERLLADLGYRGDSTKVTETLARPTSAVRAEPVKRRLERAATRSRRAVIACVLLYYFLPGGLIEGFLLLVGIGLFFASQSADLSRSRRYRWSLTAAALAVILTARMIAQLINWDIRLAARGFGVDEGRDGIGLDRYLGNAGIIIAELLPLLAVFVFVFLPVIGSAYYAKLRRTRREQMLWDAAMAGGAGSEHFLAVMRPMVDTRIEDVGFHLKYAELLFARGDHRAAAVEARLLLEQDPYHFNGNLMLANAYAVLGLWDDSLRVCDEYLAVSGYCFEFAELREQCLGRLGRT